MNFKLLKNNLIFGALILTSFLYFEVYQYRLKNKLSIYSYNQLKSLRSSLNEKALSHSEEVLRDQRYIPQDVIYLHLVNFKSFSQNYIDLLVSELETAYSSLFKDLHDFKLFVRRRTLKFATSQTLLRDPEPFSEAVLSRTNTYHLYLVNEDFSSTLETLSDRVLMRISPTSFSEPSFVRTLVRKILYHFKGLSKLQKNGCKTSNECLRRFYTEMCVLQLKSFIDSALRAQMNFNMIFADRYLPLIEERIPQLEKAIDERDVKTLQEITSLNDLYIYDTVYLYEPY